MDTPATTTTIEAIVVTTNKSIIELTKINSQESKIDKLDNAWNNYDKRLN